MKYCIIQRIRISEIESLVNEKLREGWSLYGPLVYGEALFCQPMICDRPLPEVPRVDQSFLGRNVLESLEKEK